MASWYGTARSNYVKIKDVEGLEKSLAPFPIRIAEGDGKNEGKVCFLSEEPDSGGWPGSYYDHETDEEIEFLVAARICPFMEDDQILVMMEAGAEKLRYITGNAQAYNAKGEECWMQLSDIYAKAADRFGVPRESIAAAEY